MSKLLTRPFRGITPFQSILWKLTPSVVKGIVQRSVDDEKFLDLIDRAEGKNPNGRRFTVKEFLAELAEKEDPESELESAGEESAGEES